MNDLKEYLKANRNLLALLLLLSMILGVVMYGCLYMLSKDGIEERQKLEKAGKYSMTTIYDRGDTKWLIM
jgi:hypothetical protein